MSLVRALQSLPWAWITTVVAFSLAVGSFLNVVIYRLPKILERQWRAEHAELSGEVLPVGPRYSLAFPRSHCPACMHQISALENIPLLSYLFLGGKCSSCKAKISFRYPAIEALTAALSGFIAWRYGFSWQAAGLLVFTWALIGLAFIDLDTFYLPDIITLPLLWLGLLVNMKGIYTDLPSAVLGAVAGYLILWSIFWAFKLVTGKEGMGYGDFKLLAAIGAWLGWQVLPAVILISSFVGAVIGITLIVAARHGRQTPIPFGPYLALGGLIAAFWGNALTNYYLRTI